MNGSVARTCRHEAQIRATHGQPATAKAVKREYRRDPAVRLEIWMWRWQRRAEREAWREMS